MNRNAIELAAGLALALGLAVAGGCRSASTVPVEIHFAATIRGAPFACDEEAAGVQARDLRLYVHDLQLVGSDGRTTPVVLDTDGVWQDGEVALLDFEDGSGACANGTTATRTLVVGKAAAGEHIGLRFQIGVPFAKNHADPSAADPPLNLGQMHWGWRAGYKFLRFEAASAAGPPWRLHFGSTACEGEIGAISACGFPNRIAVDLASFDRSRDVVAFELAPLLLGLSAEGGDGSCMAEADDPDCQAVFVGLGIDAKGEPSGSPAFVSARARDG